MEIDEEQLIVTFHVRLDPEAEQTCPTCGRVCPRYDTRPREWRHLDTMEYRTHIRADIPRVRCEEHGVVLTHVPWAEEASRYSSKFEALAIGVLQEMSVLSASRLLGISWSAADRIRARAVERGLSRRSLSPPRHLSIEETSFQRRHEYATVVTDQETGAVVYVADGRTIETLEPYFASLSEQELAGIQSVSMDMWPAYISVVRRYVPDADRKICFHKYHVASYLGQAVDKVRRSEHRELMRAGDERLKGTKYQWLSAPENLPRKFVRSFAALRDSALRTSKAWWIKETAMCLWHYVSPTWAKKAWDKWIDLAEESALAPVKAVAKTIRNHLQGIINAVVLGRTNAHAESTNSRIQRMKARSCGFSNRQRYRTAIMFQCGQLDMLP